MILMQTSCSITIKGKVHEARYPNVGEKLRIENLKMLLSNGQYGEFMRSGHKTALHLLDLIDAFSYFLTLVPDLKLDMDKFNALNPVDEKEIRDQYLIVYLPFFLNVELALNPPPEPKKQEEDAGAAE